MCIFHFLRRPKCTVCRGIVIQIQSFQMSSAEISEADTASVVTSADSASDTVDNSGVSCPSTQCEEL